MPVAALVVENGTGLEDADAYCDVDFVRSYFDDRGDDTFTTESNDIVVVCIRKATQFLDIEWGPRASGAPINDVQALVWPQDVETVPTKLKQATAELAKLAFAGPLAGVGAPVQSPSAAAIRKLKAGSVEVEFGELMKNQIERDAADRFYIVERLMASLVGGSDINSGTSR